MSPVSTTSNPTVGYTNKRATGLGFDPIAARNTDRPKFRLDDYKDADRTRSADPARAERAQSDWDRKPDRTRDDRNVNDEAVARSDTSGKTETGKGKAYAEKPAPDPAAQVDSANITEKTEKPVGAAAAESSAADVESTEIIADQPTSEEADVAAPVTPTQDIAPETSKKPVPGPDIAANSAGEVQGKPATQIVAATDDMTSVQAQESGPTKDTASASGSAAVQQTAASKDPKLAALEKLTQSSPSAGTTAAGTTAAGTTAAGASTGDDTTTFKLPVPWPPTASQGQTKQTVEPTATSKAAGQAPATSQTQPAATPKNAGEELPTAATKQTAAATASKGTGADIPKIEIVSSAPIKTAASGDTAVFANSRTIPAEGASKQQALPSSTETIAAATALNSRAPRSNALGGASAKRSNAVTASNENNGTKTPAGTGQPNPATVTQQQSTQTNPAATAFAAAAQPQGAVTTPEQLAQVRQQPSGSHNGPADQSGTSTSASRAPDLPGQGNNSGFADTLRTASTDRAAATPDRQTLPTPATEQVRVKLVKAAQGGLDRIKIQLNPSELGKVEVRLEFGADGGVRGTVIIDKPETMDLLQRDAKQLERALQDAGFKTGGDGLDFQMRGGGTNERHQQQAGSGNGPLSQDGGDQTGGDALPDTNTTGTEHDGIGDDGSLNLVA
ncbi:flagellar hook-length control protein FliK [Nisaea sp.]|uniref:flagellar hook-length control protein FliK n=1 Tax=Nisaea sp. TaxID=2024842 RepID=UPI0032ECD5FE